MEDLFAEGKEKPGRENLAAGMRPKTLEEFVGQEDLLGPGKALRRLIESQRFSSVIFYGPPGTGKTTLARIIGARTQAHFAELSGVEVSVQQVREAVAQADMRWRARQQRTILFVDEIHRLNKGQQDALLPHVERGALWLIGATTENPFFYVNSALISRAPVFEFKPLTHAQVIEILRRALADEARGLGGCRVAVTEEALDLLATWSDGDVRQALNGLEMAAQMRAGGEDGAVEVERMDVEEALQRKAVVYDAQGDAHYDTISAFIKAIRASEPDAAIYWLAKMILAGEDPRFIARRLVIAAAEDIGLADPAALGVCVACHQALERIGMPEGRIALAQATVYLATAPKSNSSYMALERALAEIQSGRLREVPTAWRDAHYPGASKLGRGKGYLYPHDFPKGATVEKVMADLPRFYEPNSRGYEKYIVEYLASIRP